MNEFKKLGLSDNAIQALEKKGFRKPTAIQAKVIPLLLEGKKDIIGQSQTGTGKTAGFALPILERLEEHSPTIQAIVLTPTRELALQVAEEINSLKGDKKIRVLPVYGGASIGYQMQKLKTGVDIVVGTPGRIMDLQERKSLKLNNIKYAVLDEADEMLNMGFVEDIESILQNTPKDKNVLLFSATMPKPILKIAKKYMKEYVFIEVEKAQVIVSTVEQVYYDVNSRDRVNALRRIIDYYLDFHGIIFCNTKATVDNLTHKLAKRNYRVAALHGDFAQSQREKILQQFKNRTVNILVATDVAARGIDVNDLTHIINYSLPQSPQIYVHRIGRTGRAGKKGIAITLVIPSERGKLRLVEKINSCKLVKQHLPSVREIIKNKDAQIKTKIETIIALNADKSTKYNSMAEDLLKEHSPENVIAAILKYSFKNEIDSSTYEEISEPDLTREPAHSSKSRFRGRGRDSHRRTGKSRFKRKSDHKRTDNKRSGNQSDSKQSGKNRSDSKQSDNKRSDGKSDDRRSDKKSGSSKRFGKKKKRSRKPDFAKKKKWNK